MTPQNSENDAQLHRNLQRIGARLELPTPRDAQRAAWRQGADGAAVPAQRGSRLAESRRGGWRMTQLRYLTVGGMAAALAVSAFFFGPGQSRTVQAATILTSLQHNQWQALSIELRDIVADGIHLNGDFEIAFDRPLSIAQLLKDHDATGAMLDLGDSVTIDGFYFDVTVQAGPTAEEDVEGLDLFARGGLTRPDAAWVFVQPRSLPRAVVEETPFANIVTMMFGNGVLLDLDEFAPQAFDLLKAEQAAAGDDVVADDAARQKKVEVELRVGGDVPDEQDLAAATRVAVAEAEAVADAADEERSGLRIHIDGQEDQRIEQLVRGLLTGDATRDEIQEMLKEIESEDANITLDSRGSGLHVLSVQGLEADDEMINANTAIEIGYQEGSGVEWLSINDLGAAHGRIHVAFQPTPKHLATTARQQMLADGVRPVKVADLIEMFGAQLGGEFSFESKE